MFRGPEVAWALCCVWESLGQLLPQTLEMTSHTDQC